MYPEISGVQEEYRLAVSEFEKKNQGMDYDPASTVITAGVAGFMNVLHYALLIQEMKSSPSPLFTMWGPHHMSGRWALV